MVRTVELDETEHAVTLLHGFKQLRHEEDLCDFTIQVDKVEYRVHKTVLAVRSPYFKAMLKHDVKESQEAKVEMKEVDAECVKNCIDFMYSGKFDIPDGKTDKLLHVAIMMQLEDITGAICNILIQDLNAEYFYETRNIANMYQLSTVLTHCAIYYNENFMSISSQPDFRNEEKSILFDILKANILDLSEDDKLVVTLRWAGNDPGKAKDLSELINLVKLQTISPRYLSHVLRDHPLISNDLELYKLMSDSLIGSFEKSRGDELMVLFDQDTGHLQSYNPATYEMSKFHDEKFTHLKRFTTVSVDSYIYVLCGNRSVHRLNYKDINSKWERMQNMIADHGYYPPSVAFSGSLFVIGSRDPSNPSKHVEKFDPLVNNWQGFKDKPVAVHWHTLVTLGYSIYCVAGADDSKSPSALAKFTPSTSEWVDLQPMKSARHACGAVAVEQRIFVMGGWWNGEKKSEVQCYNVTSDQWTCLSPMLGCHGTNIAHYINGCIYSVSRFVSSNEIEKYDIVADKWSKVKLNGDLDFKVHDCSWITL